MALQRQHHGPGVDDKNVYCYPDWCIGTSADHQRARKIIDRADISYACVSRSRSCIASFKHLSCATCSAVGYRVCVCNLPGLPRRRAYGERTKAATSAVSAADERHVSKPQKSEKKQPHMDEENSDGGDGSEHIPDGNSSSFYIGDRGCTNNPQGPPARTKFLRSSNGSSTSGSARRHSIIDVHFSPEVEAACITVDNLTPAPTITSAGVKSEPSDSDQRSLSIYPSMAKRSADLEPLYLA